MMYYSGARSVSCTCQAPPCVEISTTVTEVDCSENPRRDDPSCETAAAAISKQQLLQNLKKIGWSPVRCREVGFTVPSHASIQDLFAWPRTGSDDDEIDEFLTYRSQESGGTNQAVEPKESLELEQASIRRKDRLEDGVTTDTSPSTSTTTTNSSFSSYSRVRDWCLALSRIAHTVNGILQMPPNVFLLQEEKVGIDMQESERLDLLRVFFYHSVPSSSSVPPHQPQLGSSPHTDWGSWTVVWQDSVGGLETYCRHCQKWIPVAATPQASSPSTRKDDTWDCIIHVGDMASLGLGRPPAADPAEEDLTNNTYSPTIVQWPSPRHRVVSPTNGQTRTSLVYFAYPPASCSIQKMQTAVSSYWTTASNSNNSNRRNSPKEGGDDQRGRCLPLSEFSLLQDQSLSSLSAAAFSSSERNAQETYNRIKALSIREVVQDKWKQVQRNSD